MRGIDVPEPVFSCSIEAESAKDQVELEHALANMQREDSSLRTSVDEETGQTILSGGFFAYTNVAIINSDTL